MGPLATLKGFVAAGDVCDGQAPKRRRCRLCGMDWQI